MILSQSALPVAVMVDTPSLCDCSVRINERKHRGVADNKKMAYLVDLKTIAISKCAECKQVVSLTMTYSHRTMTYLSTVSFPVTNLAVIF